MPHPDATSALNHLYYLMRRSFAAYSLEVRPVTFRGPEEMRELLQRVAGEQRLLAERIAEAIREQNGALELGQFPIEFTAWNDVALPRILERSIQLFGSGIADAAAIAATDLPAPVYHFAREVLHLTKRHVEMLENALAAKRGNA